MRGHGLVLGAVDLTVRITRDAKTVTVEADKANDLVERPRFAFCFKTVELASDGETVTTAPVLVPCDLNEIKASRATLTKNQQTMFSMLHDAGPRGLTTEEWNERARGAGLGRRKADLYDFRAALEAKQLVRQYDGR